MGRAISFTIRKWHKWLSLIIGIQALIWLVSGTYMVIVNLDFIHGDHLVKNMGSVLNDELNNLISMDEIVARFPDATNVKLVSWMDKPFYRVTGIRGNHLVNARTGVLRSPLSQSDALAVARYHYAGDGTVAKAELISLEQERPSELQGRPLPLWRVQFRDSGTSSFYISPDHGELVTRRHVYWRLFDFMWMLHIMDYEAREDVNNNLFRAVATIGSIMAIFGLWLLLYSFRRKDKTGDNTKASGGIQ